MLEISVDRNPWFENEYLLDSDCKLVDYLLRYQRRIAQIACKDRFVPASEPFCITIPKDHKDNFGWYRKVNVLNPYRWFFVGPTQCKFVFRVEFGCCISLGHFSNLKERPTFEEMINCLPYIPPPRKPLDIDITSDSEEFQES